jgi:hypothetical protein
MKSERRQFHRAAVAFAHASHCKMRMQPGFENFG